MTHPSEEGPIEADLHGLMNGLAHALGEVLGPQVGFALLTFKLGEPGRANYISNANRADMLVALKEFVARAEARYHETETPQ